MKGLGLGVLGLGLRVSGISNGSNIKKSCMVRRLCRNSFRAPFRFGLLGVEGGLRDRAKGVRLLDFGLDFKHPPLRQL